MLETNFILAVAVTFVIAGFVKGVLGQGLPTVAVGLLALIMSPGEAAALIVIPSLVTNIWQAWYSASSFFLGMLALGVHLAVIHR